MGTIVPAISRGLNLANMVAGGALPIIGAATDLASNIGNFTEDDRRPDPAAQLQREQELALAQLKARQTLNQQQLDGESALEREKIAADTKAAEDKRRAALRRAVARQNARFGASGIDTGSGSAQAVLLGLFEDNDNEREERTRMDGLRTRALDLSLDNRSSLNVLQRTQLQQRQKLEREVLF